MNLPLGSTRPITLGPLLNSSNAPVTSAAVTVVTYVNGVKQSSAGTAANTDTNGCSEYTPAGTSVDTGAQGQLLILASASTAVPWSREYQVGLSSADLQQIAQETFQTTTNVWHLTPSGNDSSDGLSAATAKLTTAALTIAANDIVRFAPGTWTVGFSPANACQLLGAGMGATYVVASTGIGMPGGIVSDMSVIDSSTGSNPPIGINNAAANLTVKRCYCSGGIDGLWAEAVNDLWVEDCYLTSGWDSCNVRSSGLAVVKNTTMASFNAAGTSITRALAITGIAIAMNCDILASNTGTGGNGINSALGSAPQAGCFGVVAGAGGATNLVLINCRIELNYTSPASWDYAIYACTGSTVTCYGCTFDRSKVYGNVIDLPLSALPVELAAFAAQTKAFAAQGPQETITDVTGNVGFAAAVANGAAGYTYSSGTFTTTSFRINGLNGAAGSYVGQYLTFSSGTLAGQSRQISGYTVAGSTKTITVGTAFGSIPSHTEYFNVAPSSATSFISNLPSTNSGDYVGDTITFTSGGQAGNSATVTGYTYTADGVGILTVGSGLGAAPAVGDAFLIGNPSSSGFATNLSNSTAGFFVGQNLTFTSGAQAGNTAAISGYTWDATNSVGDVTLGSGLSGAPALGDAFEVGLLSSTQFTTSLATSYVGQYIVFVSGALIGQETLVTDFNTSTGLMTVAAGLSGAPAYGDSFVVLNFAAGAALVPIATAVGVSGGAAVAPGNAAGLSRVEDLTATGTVTAIQGGLSKPGTAQTIVPNSNVNVNQWNGGALPTSFVASNMVSLTGIALTTDVTGAVTSLETYMSSTGIAANNLPTDYLSTTEQNSLAALAKAVGSTGMVSTTPAPGASTGLARVEDLPPAVVGPGGKSFTVTVEDTGGNPIANVSVWVTSDIGGTTVIAGTLLTNSLGQVTFTLPTGTAYVWRMSSGYTFTNPQAITVV